MLQESISDEEEVLVLTWESTLMHNKVTFLVARLVKILFWVDFENVVAHLETDWLNLRGNIFAAVLNMAESLVTGAIKIWEGLRPLNSKLLENIGWDGELGTTSIDDGWVASVLTGGLQAL